MPWSIVSGRGSAWLERLVRDQEVGGSNPLAPTYRTEDRALSHPQVNLPGFERAFGSFSFLYLVESQFDPFHQ